MLNRTEQIDSALAHAPAQGDALMEPIESLLTQLAHRRLHTIAVRLLRSQASNLTLGPTALVHEGFIKMFTSDQFRGIQTAQHFYATFTASMKHAIVDYFRMKGAAKRTNGIVLQPYRFTQIRPRLVPEISEVDIADALLTIADQSDLAARAVSVFEMQYYGGLTVKEIAKATGQSRSTVESDLRFVKACLRTQFDPNFP